MSVIGIKVDDKWCVGACVHACVCLVSDKTEGCCSLDHIVLFKHVPEDAAFT